MQSTISITELANDVDEGLSSDPKYLNSKYFYDAIGSAIFQKIMHMPEYYLTDCELEIFNQQKKSIFQHLNLNDQAFDVVELGAGDGLKTKILLEYFLDQNPAIKYIPIDISDEAVINLEKDLRRELPNLNVEGKIGDYFGMMEALNEIDTSPKVIMFLGSNIGNFNHQKSIDFLSHLGEVMNANDNLILGFDLKKDPDIIMNAYNNPHGYTASFNLNLLRRINEELDGTFELLKYEHFEVYDPQTGTAKSYLISKTEQSVKIGALEKIIHFKKWEPVFMEMSQKYDEEMIQNLADEAGFEIIKNFTDDRQYFINSIWKPKQIG